MHYGPGICYNNIKSCNVEDSYEPLTNLDVQKDAVFNFGYTTTRDVCGYCI